MQPLQGSVCDKYFVQSFQLFVGSLVLGSQKFSLCTKLANSWRSFLENLDLSGKNTSFLIQQSQGLASFVHELILVAWQPFGLDLFPRKVESGEL